MNGWNVTQMEPGGREFRYGRRGGLYNLLLMTGGLLTRTKSIFDYSTGGLGMNPLFLIHDGFFHE